MITRLLLLLTLLTFSSSIWAQEDCSGASEASRTYLEANNIKALIDPSGSLFWDGSEAGFTYEGEGESISTIFAQGLWISNLDPGGTIYLAGAQYGKSYGDFDYYPGPIYTDPVTFENFSDLEHCEEWDKTWSVTREEIEAHRADFADNGVIDNPIAAIINWPGRGNENLDFLPTNQERFAPFWDSNANSIYNPMSGDHPFLPQNIDTPAPFPDQMTWCVFHTGIGAANDSGANQSSALEIHLLTWAYNCSDNEVMNNTIFTSYQIVSHNIEPMLNTKIGFWNDFDLGCYTDDYIGSAPELNTFFAYNQDNEDDQCEQLVSAGVNPPVQSVTILNKSLDKFIYMNNGTSNPAFSDPQTDLDFYNYLNGQFIDGTPLTEGGNGYNTGDPTNFVFPGDPNNTDEWSELQSNLPTEDRRALGVVNIPDNLMLPGAILTIDLAYSYHREPNASNLENVTAMYENVAAIQTIYDANFTDFCNQVTATETPIWATDIKLFPNPASNKLNISYGNTAIDQLQIWDTYGRLLMTIDEQKQTLDVTNLAAGIYYLKLNNKGESLIKKFVKI